MRILATVDNRQFIAQLSIQEIDYLAGRKIGSDKGYYGVREISAGTTFDIVAGFGQIRRNERRLQDVETLRKGLQGMLAGLDMMTPFIEEPKTQKMEAE